MISGLITPPVSARNCSAAPPCAVWPTSSGAIDSATDDSEEIAGALSPDAANLVGQVAGLARDAVLDDGQEDTELEAIISAGRKTITATS